MAPKIVVENIPDGCRSLEGSAKDFYKLTGEDIAKYKRDGYLSLPQILSKEELAVFESVFDDFTTGKIRPPDKDFCDMSLPYGTPFEQWRLVNAMLPRRYSKLLVESIFERRALSIAKQLFGEDMVLDFDHFLLKRPSKTGEDNGAVFSWHQDIAYWPKDTPDFRTATISLALNDVAIENGCLRVVPGSHREPRLRTHQRLDEEGHALTVGLKDSDTIVYLPLKAGDITIHNERIVHGSGGNSSRKVPRKTYILVFRSKQTVEHERKLGFTHSHNDYQPPINSNL